MHELNVPSVNQMLKKISDDKALAAAIFNFWKTKAMESIEISSFHTSEQVLSKLIEIAIGNHNFTDKFLKIRIQPTTQLSGVNR